MLLCRSRRTCPSTRRRRGIAGCESGRRCNTVGAVIAAVALEVPKRVLRASKARKSPERELGIGRAPARSASLKSGWFAPEGVLGSFNLMPPPLSAVRRPFPPCFMYIRVYSSVPVCPPSAGPFPLVLCIYSFSSCSRYVCAVSISACCMADVEGNGEYIQYANCNLPHCNLQLQSAPLQSAFCGDPLSPPRQNAKKSEICILH